MITILIVFLVLLIIGVPVAFTIGASGMVSSLQNAHFLLTHVTQLPLTQVQGISTLVIPLLILVENLMNNGGVARRLVDLATLPAGHMRGGLARTSMVLSTLIGGVSGSATAGAAMETRFLDPDMIKSGYSEGFSANMLTFISLITATIPPGVGLIIYDTTGSVPIGKLFPTDIFVGLYMVIALVVSVAAIARMRGCKPIYRERTTLREIGISLKETIWAVMFPMILLVGIRMGFSSSSKVGASTCFYSVFVDVSIYKELTVQSFLKALKDSIGDIGSIMMIVSLIASFGYGTPIDEIPQEMIAFITGVITNPTLMPVLIIIPLVSAGIFVEGSVTILPLIPILLPMCQSVGIDPVHLGLLMCVIVTMGANTSPVRMSMCTANTILDCSLQGYIKSTIPFLVATLLAIELLVLFPDVVLFLSRLLY